MSCSSVTKKGFSLIFTPIHRCKQTNNIGPTYSQLPVRWEPLQPSILHSMIRLECNVQVGRRGFHFYLKLTIYFSELPTSIHYHLSHLFHRSKSLLHKHLGKVRAVLNWAKQMMLHSMHHPLGYSCNTDTSNSTAILWLQPLKIWHRRRITTWPVKLEPAWMRFIVPYDVCESISMWLARN
jgi:hypothetical protein